MFSRTPDEIKQGLMCLVGGEELEDTCGGCAYLDTRGPCVDHVLPDVLALVEQLQATVSEKEKVIAELSGKIGQLEADNKLLQDAVDQWELVAASPGAVEDMARAYGELVEKVEQLQAERDAAVRDMTIASVNACDVCKNNELIVDEAPCQKCTHIFKGRDSKFEWRGVQKEG